ncbi:MAG: DNA-3-methyladenine glycosylase [Euryarchaeota archaeon]|nr:DNA-3-methyladenine glycosylase [Euryarchaeota archaeon]|tara:strand:- start:735 stop:1361 length:627 start_codon:yes stop_codon:yes gene_type:complete
MTLLGDRPDYWETAKKELSDNDIILSRIINKFDDLELISRGDIFFTLIRSIIGQQISVKAASTVWSRFTEKVGEITPKNILSVDFEDLRSCGLSQKKTEYVIGISESWHEYSLFDWNKMDDEEVIEKLIKLRGVGKWTAEMILIFTLLRPDVFPIGDIGMIRGIEKSYNSGVRMSNDELYALSEKWKPWRTVACCYMWRTVDPEPVEY